MYKRLISFDRGKGESFFLWGARQTGKSTLLKNDFGDSLWFDLLQSDVFERFHRNPSQFREVIVESGVGKSVVVDEVQKIPALLDEIHWLIENYQTQFILSGSSPRKIIRSGANLLGGRALRYELLPLVSHEIPDFDLLKALNRGLLPRHYLSPHPKKFISSYIGSYLQDEIMAEARLRNTQVFAGFLESAAFSNGEIINYSNIASDCGVSSNTVKDYFQILFDTLIGRLVNSYQKRPKRRVILAPKFYYFDVGIANYLVKRGKVEPGSEAFGAAFEHFIYQELYAHSQYSEIDYPIYYWRTASQIEVDFILGDHEVAVEVKSTGNVNSRHARGLRAFADEYKVNKKIIISNDPFPRKIGEVLVLPYQEFLNRLWSGEIIR